MCIKELKTFYKIEIPTFISLWMDRFKLFQTQKREGRIIKKTSKKNL